MSEPLFLPVHKPLQKFAGHRLSHDPKKWGLEIVKLLHESHPYLTNHTVRTVFNARDDEHATATGDIFVDNKIDVPFVIDQGELQPLDMFMHGGELIPMTRRAVAEALIDTSFGTSIPAGSGETADVFNTNAIPPFDGKYTFASDGCYDRESAEDRIRMHEEAIGMPSHPNKTALENDPGTGGTCTIESASIAYTPGDNSALDDVLNSISLEPKHHYSFGKAASALPAVKQLFDQTPEDLIAGQWRLKTAFGATVSGTVFPNVIDPFSSYCSDKPMFIASQGHGYAQEYKAVGDTVKEGAEVKDSEIKLGAVGVFCWDDGTTFPVKIAGITDDGIEVEQPCGTIKSIIRKTAGVKVAYAEDGEVFIPEEAIFHKVADNPLDLSTPLVNVPNFTILHQGGQYALSGDGFNPEPGSYYRVKRALCEHFEPESVSDVLKLVASKGAVRIQSPTKMEKTASHSLKNNIPEKYLKMANVQAIDATEAIIYINQVDLSPLKGLEKVGGWVGKIAAELTDDAKGDTVDAILGANFLTEETLYKFLDKIDDFKRARQSALELLLASRLGLEVPQGPIRAAAFALDGVVSGLDQLRQLMSAGE